MKQIPILSLGMGVESVAILLRWISEPECRDFDLKDLIVISAQTGDEYKDTKKDMEAFILPLMRAHGIRYVQVARGGHLEEDGIVVLDDSRTPTICHTAGAYKLSDELGSAGTVPQFGGEHRCSLKFKAFVIEAWLEENIYEPIRHVFGYNADELTRIKKSDAAIQARIAFGFNNEEPARILKGEAYDHPLRVGWYPLADWGWNRDQCLDYIFHVLGTWWKKSACVFCPFAKLTDAMKARHMDHPADVAEALLLEYSSLTMNPRGTLFRDKSLLEVTRESGNAEALTIFTNKLRARSWAMYRVRRIYTKKGKAHREVRKLETGTQDEMEEAVIRQIDYLGLKRKHLRGIAYAYRMERTEDVYPSREEYFVAAPATVEDKSRYGYEWFEARWNLIAPGAPAQGALSL